MRLIEDIVVPNNTGRAFTLSKGQHIRIIGQSTVDFVAFNLDNLRERFDQARTKAFGHAHKIFISTGDMLSSKFNNAMFTIIEDTYREGTHDMEKGMCSRRVYEQMYERGVYSKDLKKEDLPDHGCWENLSQALKPWHIAPEDIPSPLNIFQTMEINGTTGEMRFTQTKPKAGTYVELRAEMNCLVGISACPEFHEPIRVPPPIRVQIYQE